MPEILAVDSHQQTGPKAPQAQRERPFCASSSEAKARSSANATLHGGTSRRLIVAGENPADFHSLLDGLLLEYCPQTETAHNLVQDAALARWFLWRRQRAYNSIEAALYAAEADETRWSDAQSKQLFLADRYKTNAERAFKRAFSNIESLRKTRLAEQRSAEREQAGRDMHERRLSLLQEKLEIQQSAEARKQKHADRPNIRLSAKAADEEARALHIEKWEKIKQDMEAREKAQRQQTPPAPRPLPPQPASVAAES